MDDAEVNPSSTATNTNVDDEEQRHAYGRHRKEDSEITIHDDNANSGPPSSDSSSSRRGKSRRAFTKCLNAILGWPSLMLENSGSVARDHLASEPLVQLFSLTGVGTSSRLRKVGTILGAITVIMGILIMTIGTSRYFRNQHLLMEGSFLPARHTIWVISFVLGSVVVIIFGVLLDLTGAY